MIYFTIYLIWIGIQFDSIIYLQFLTQWSLILLVAYLGWSAVANSYTFIRILILRKEPHKPLYVGNKEKLDKPPGCCGTTIDSTSWYHKVQWVLFILGTEAAIGITLLWWIILFDPERSDGSDHNNIAVHLLNGIVSYIDVWITGIPIRLYHFYVIVIFGSVYSTFAGIHHAAFVIPNTTEPIYEPLDYSSNPAVASLYTVLIPLIYFPIIHLICYGSYLLREALLFVIKKKCLKKDNNPLEHELK